MWLGWRVLQQPGACLLHAGCKTLFMCFKQFLPIFAVSTISVTFILYVSGSRSARVRSQHQQSLLSPLDKSEQRWRQSGAGWRDRGTLQSPAVVTSMYINIQRPFCEALARVRQGSARDGSQGERPQSFKPCLELTLKLVATHHHQKFHFT